MFSCSLAPFCSYLYTFTLTLPDSVSIYASFPDAAAATGEGLCSQHALQLNALSAQLNTCSQCALRTVAQCSVLTANCHQPVIAAALHAYQVTSRACLQYVHPLCARERIWHPTAVTREVCLHHSHATAPVCGVRHVHHAW